MTLHRWLGVFCYVVMTIAVGHLAVRCFRSKHRGLAHNWAVYYLSGQLILTSFSISTAFLPWSLTHLKWLLVALVGTYWIYTGLRQRTSARRAGMTVVRWGGLLLGTMVLFPDIFVLVNNVPLRDWDPRSTWMFQGKAMYVCGRVDWEFFTSPLYTWSGRDYPLLIPAQ